LHCVTFSETRLLQKFYLSGQLKRPLGETYPWLFLNIIIWPFILQWIMC